MKISRSDQALETIRMPLTSKRRKPPSAAIFAVPSFWGARKREPAIQKLQREIPGSLAVRDRPGMTAYPYDAPAFAS
jgi:hypothetical protein